MISPRRIEEERIVECPTRTSDEPEVLSLQKLKEASEYYWKTQVRRISPSGQKLLSDWARKELGLSQGPNNSSDTTAPNCKLKTGNEFIVQNCKFENLHWLDVYIDKVEQGESPTFDEFCKWGAFGPIEKTYDLAAENVVNVSLPALDTQIDLLLESTNKLLDTVTSATVLRNNNKLSANLNPTSENMDSDEESLSCHPHCLRCWNNKN